MKKLNFKVLLAGAVLISGLTAVDLSAQGTRCGAAKTPEAKKIPEMKCAPGKCGAAMKNSKMKCGASKKPVKMKCGAKKSEAK
jgi:uncharacterized low-complexity protein